MEKCTICGRYKDIYDLTLQCCFDCRHKIDEQAEIEKIKKSIKEFNKRNNVEYGSSNCDIPMPQGFGEQKGWICPVCGRGLAPWVDFCPCQGSEIKITYGTTVTEEELYGLKDYYDLLEKKIDLNRSEDDE